MFEIMTRDLHMYTLMNHSPLVVMTSNLSTCLLMHTLDLLPLQHAYSHDFTIFCPSLTQKMAFTHGKSQQNCE